MSLAEKILVRSHPRSGTHFLAYSISTNFFNTEDYSKLLNSGVHSSCSGVFPTNTKVVYIWRSWEAVLDSLWKMRRAFCIEEDDRKAFLLNRYFNSAKNWSSKSGGVELLATDHNRTTRYSPFKTFIGLRSQPHQYWAFHCMSYIQASISSPSVLVVNYETLLSNFQTEMLRISSHIGSTETIFKYPDKMIGYRPCVADV
jgi:hypothetical protein